MKAGCVRRIALVLRSSSWESNKCCTLLRILFVVRLWFCRLKKKTSAMPIWSLNLITNENTCKQKDWKCRNPVRHFLCQFRFNFLYSVPYHSISILVIHVFEIMASWFVKIVPELFLPTWSKILNRYTVKLLKK